MLTPAGYLGLIVVVLALGLLAYKAIHGGPNNAVGYTSEHGYCPNMGACNDCDVCEGD